MHRYRFSLLLLSIFTATAMATTADTERLLAEVPDDWEKVIDRNVGSLHLAEYYPPGSNENWTRKLTLEALSGSDLPDPLVYVEGLAAEQGEVCNEFSNNPVFAGFENGYPTTVNILACGESKVSGRGLLTMIKIIRANQALYTVSRIWRVPAVAGSADPSSEGGALAAVDQVELGSWAATLRRVQVCDSALDAHPCPKTNE